MRCCRDRLWLTWLFNFEGLQTAVYFASPRTPLEHFLLADRQVEAVVDCAGRLPRRPRASAFSRMAAKQKAMCSSMGMPSSAAPLRTSSRETPLANALSFSFLATEEVSRSRM